MSNSTLGSTNNKSKSSPPQQPTMAPVGKRRNTYLVASHSVRITKFGYAIDPVELRYAEVSNKLTVNQRRQSDLALDSGQLGHRVLTLIRGFWSQPAWPRGRQMNSKQQQHQEQLLQQMFRLSPTENPVDSLITSFRSSSFYPHKFTLGQMSIAPVSPPPPPVTKAAQTKSQAGNSFDSTKRKDKKKGSSSQSSLSSKFKTQRSAPDLNVYFMTWIPKNKDLIAELITELCQKVEQVFAGESRVLNIKSPCLVLGDIHGNLLDLRTYERSLWPKAPSCLTNNYLFLGDYVDRGEHSVECVLYLFAMKLIAPNRFFLLRGNHEIASIQRQYTFGNECEAKFGTAAGRQLWRSFNRVFNVMPIAAIIDDQIFCAHGGIPRSVTDVSNLARDIPVPLENPEIQSAAAWEILWNDPITDSELIAMLEMDSSAANVTAVGSRTGSVQDSQTQAQNTTGTGSDQAPATPSQPVTIPQTSTIESPTSTPTDSTNKSPFETALSFYIKPEQESTQQQRKEQAKTIASSHLNGANEPKAAPTSTAVVPPASPTFSDTLRAVPSDTSSIASTTPGQLVNDGFVANIKRGTAFLFSDRAIDNFLEVNKFSHIIRAHEVIPTGFAFHGDGRVITIFSSSQYCGLNNQAACALVDSDRIRILRLDTGQAGE